MACPGAIDQAVGHLLKRPNSTSDTGRCYPRARSVRLEFGRTGGRALVIGADYRWTMSPDCHPEARCFDVDPAKVNALAAVALVGVDGLAISAGDMENGAWFAAVYDSAVPAMVLLSGNDRGARDGDSWTGVHDFTGAMINAGTLTVAGTATGVTPTTGDAPRAMHLAVALPEY